MTKKNGRTIVTLRLTRNMIDLIDKVRVEQRFTTPRNTLVSEAGGRRIHEAETIKTEQK